MENKTEKTLYELIYEIYVGVSKKWNSSSDNEFASWLNAKLDEYKNK